MKGFFFNAQPTDDIIAHPSGWDREYDALDYNTCTAIFYENGIFANRDPNACKVTANGLVLTVAPGVALINGGQCHFEEGDSVTLTNGDGKYSIMCRKNNAAEVRAFEFIALHLTTEFPAPVRAGDIYDLCFAHVTVAGGTVSITDTRSDVALCGFAALAAMPPYYPPDSDSLPYVLWLYTLGLPMTSEQLAAVESNPSLMAIVNASKTRPASTSAAGIVKLSSATDNDNETTAATSKAVKMVMQIADSQKVVTGTYTGDGTSFRQIDVGFDIGFLILFGSPVLVWYAKNLTFSHRADSSSGQSYDTAQLPLSGSKFPVKTSLTLAGTSMNLNYNGTVYSYIAFRSR